VIDDLQSVQFALAGDAAELVDHEAGDLGFGPGVVTLDLVGHVDQDGQPAVAQVGILGVDGLGLFGREQVGHEAGEVAALDDAGERQGGDEQAGTRSALHG
jgi:hypothetical protein